jgi:hypothetical protein
MQSASTLTLAPAARVPIVAVAGLLVALLLAALHTTIVATAMPSIAARLRPLQLGHRRLPAYHRVCRVCVPVVARLTDHYGRRVYLIGWRTDVPHRFHDVRAGRFLRALVAFRLLQGVGAGSITRRGARRRAGPVRTLRRRLSLEVGNLNLVASALRQLGIVARR